MRVVETGSFSAAARQLHLGQPAVSKMVAQLARLHVVPRLAAFLAEHPALEMHVVLDDQNIDLIEAGIHVALRMGSLEDSTLIARKIAQCPRLVLATPAYFAKHGEPTVPADLTAHHAIVYDVPGGGTVLKTVDLAQLWAY